MAKKTKKPAKPKKTTKKAAKPVKKPVKKAPNKPAAKKSPAKKAPKKTVPAKKTAVKASKPVKKSAPINPVKKAAAKPVAKKAVKKAAKTVERKPATLPSPAPVRPAPLGHSRVSLTQPHRKKSKPEKKLTAKELKDFRQALLNLRDQVVDGISFLSGDNLNRSQRDASGDLSGYSLHMADQGTDNYDREFALNLVSSEQDILYEIDEALRRLDAGTYGICEMTAEPIERARLKVLPHARYSVTAQSEMEKGKTRYRPFGPTLTHGG